MQKSKSKSKKLVLNNLSVPLNYLFILTALILFGCESKIKPPVTEVKFGYDFPSQESWNTTITFTDSGRVTGILRAGHIAMFGNKKITMLDSSVIVDFFDDQQNHTSILTSRRGMVNDISHDFEVHEDVVVRSDSGTVLRTEDLYWANASQKVHTPSYVEITSPTEQIQGHGFESDKSLKHYTIFKVTGKAKTNEK